MPNLTIVHPGALGDVLLALPAVRTLRAAHPSDRLRFVAHAAVGRFLEACGEIDTAIPIEGAWLTDLLSGDLARLAGETTLPSGCDRFIGWLRDPDGALARTMQRLGLQDCIIRSPADETLRAVHQTDRVLEIIGLRPTAAAYAPVSLPAQAMAAGRTWLRGLLEDSLHDAPLLVVHPGSGSPHKCIAPERVAELMTWAREQGLGLLLVGGPADVRALEQVRSSCPFLIRCISDLDLLAMASVLAHAACFLGHDSGLSHVAAALGLPTVIVFGPTQPARWAPWRPTTLVQGAPCRCDGWEAVQRCQEKWCLRMPPQQLEDACTRVLRASRSHCLCYPTTCVRISQIY